MEKNTLRKMIPITKPLLDQNEILAAERAISSGWITQGVKVQEFEIDFANYVGAGYACAVSSCTTALHIALIVSDIRQGDEVILPSLSFIATANAVLYTGAIPVFADVNPEICNIDPLEIEKCITPRTKAIIPVHQMGLPADLDAINAIAKRHGLKVIEDAACAVGSMFKGKRIGGHGNITCFSLHPRKIITTGEGGMITTDNSEIASKLKRLRHHGMSLSDVERHASNRILIEEYNEIGYNYRMTDIQAGIGIEQLKKLPFIIDRRREIGEFYNNELATIPFLKVPRFPEYLYTNYQSYWVELLNSSPLSRDDLMQKLLDKGISTRRGIMAIHLENCYKEYKTILPFTERITRNTFLLPIFPAIKRDDLKYIVESINGVLQ